MGRGNGDIEWGGEWSYRAGKVKKAIEWGMEL